MSVGEGIIRLEKHSERKGGNVVVGNIVFFIISVFPVLLVLDVYSAFGLIGYQIIARHTFLPPLPEEIYRAILFYLAIVGGALGLVLLMLVGILISVHFVLSFVDREK